MTDDKLNHQSSERPQGADSTTTSRRDFLVNGGRVAALAAIGFSATHFFIRSLDCEGHSVCDACLVVKKCELPLGKEFKDGETANGQGPDSGTNPAHHESLSPIDVSRLKELDHDA